MGENEITPPIPESTGKWIAKVAAAVVLAGATWSFIVSITNNLILPVLARVMGGDPQSPLYLGKGDFNVPAIFSSILQLCMGGIAAALLYQWSRSAPRVRVKTVKVRTVAPEAGMPSILPATATPVVSAPAPVATPVIAREAIHPQTAPIAAAPVAAPPMVPAPPASVAVPQPKPSAPQPAPAAKQQKPKKPTEVYYNIVGEPINPTEDD